MPPPDAKARSVRVLAWCMAVVILVAVHAAVAQDAPGSYVDRPVGAVTINGLRRVPEQLVRNQLRTQVGDPYDPDVVSEDLRRLTRLGEFRFVTPEVVPRDDGTVEVVFDVAEQPIITEVQVVGNKRLSDQEILAAVRLVPGVPRDDYLIEKAKRDIAERYREKGHYLATVTVDEQALEESGVLLLRVIEGPRVKVRAIEFEGNDAFTDDQLEADLKTRTAFPLIRQGVLDEDLLAEDVATLDRYYKDRGHLDVRVDRRIELSPDTKEAKVTFIVEEGPQYTLRRVRAIDAVEGGPLRVFAVEQIAALLEIRPGDVYSRDLLRKSITIVEQAYGRLGYIGATVQAVELRPGEGSEVDLLLEIDEGTYGTVGLVHIAGNSITRDKVIRRLVRLRPGRPFDATEIKRSEKRLRDTRLFNDVRINVQDPDPDDPLVRDVLVEIKERDTGSVNFGIAVGSDSGVFGEFSVNQTNFDVSDWPESFEELVKGAAFRGAGQRFSMVVRPGDEIFQYAVSITEPHLLETDYSLRAGFSYKQRFYDVYDEDRLSGTLQLARRLGDVWELAVLTRLENVELNNIEDDAPTEVYRDAGPSTLDGIGVSLVRTTITDLVRPGRGSRFELSYEHVGLFSSDVDFNIVSAEFTTYFTLSEDFLGRISTLRLNARTAYVYGGRAPVYEQLYLGGRSFRGFDFRTVSPKGIRNDTGGPSRDPVGGEFLFFLGAQYEFPLLEEALTGVVFIDSGTVLDEISLDDYRASVGVGVRMLIPQLGPVPLAFDLAFPIASQASDDEQVFSFTAELPF